MLSRTFSRLSLSSAIVAAMLTFSMAPASAFTLSSPSLEPSFADSRIEKVYYYYGYRHYYHPYYHHRYYHHPYYRHRYYYHPYYHHRYYYHPYYRHHYYYHPYYYHRYHHYRRYHYY